MEFEMEKITFLFMQKQNYMCSSRNIRDRRDGYICLYIEGFRKASYQMFETELDFLRQNIFVVSA